MKINYTELREKLSAANPDDWGSIVFEAIERGRNKEDELGFNEDAVSDVVIGEASIEASVCYMVFGEATPDDNGDYQDEDGESYDYPEQEYSYLLVVSSTGTRWEAV